MINKEELALAIAEKYLELEELAGKVGAYRAMRLDWARYGEDGLDEVLESLRSGLEAFDRELQGTLSDGEYVRHALENIMDAQAMDEAQRARFLGTVRAFVEQAGAERLKPALDGSSENVLRALLRMSETGAPDDTQQPAGEALDSICRAAEAAQAAQRPPLKDIDGAAADELMRCYAAFCVLRDGGVEGVSLSDDCLRFIGASVRAGQAQSDVLRAGQEGRMSGERVAEVLRAVAEALLIALALFVSGAMGVYAGLSVVQLAGLLLGFGGVLGGVALALGIVCGLPVGVKVTCDMLKLCAKAGMWLEQAALEPGAARLAEWFDGAVRFVERKAPELKQGVDDARTQLGCAAGAAWQGAQRAWAGAQPQLAGMAGGALSWLEHAGGELDAAIGRVLSAFGAADEGGQA